MTKSMQDSFKDGAVGREPAPAGACGCIIEGNSR